MYAKKGRINGLSVIVRLSKIDFLLLGVTTMSISDAPRFVKENTTEKGMKHVENEATQIDWPEVMITLTELGIIKGSILSRVDLNGPSSIELEMGT